MAKQPTLGERMAVMEKLHEILNEAVKQNGVAAEAVAQRVLTRIDEMEMNTAKRETQRDAKVSQRFDALEAELREHKQDYAALKNKGIGAFAVISVVFAGLGFLANKFWNNLVGVFS